MFGSEQGWRWTVLAMWLDSGDIETHLSGDEVGVLRNVTG
jgi:hypothetical protein